jgi:hypothetical protein
MTDASRARSLPGQRFANGLVRALLATPGIARLVGTRLVTLYVIGRKSKRRYAIPVAYLLDGDDLLIGTPFGWGRNLRSGEPIQLRLKRRLRSADVQVDTAEPEVVRGYAHMARANPAFATFNRIRIGEDGAPDHDDLRQAWLGGARVIRLSPR